MDIGQSPLTYVFIVIFSSKVHVFKFSMIQVFGTISESGLSESNFTDLMR